MLHIFLRRSFLICTVRSKVDPAPLVQNHNVSPKRQKKGLRECCTHSPEGMLDDNIMHEKVAHLHLFIECGDQRSPSHR